MLHKSKCFKPIPEKIFKVLKGKNLQLGFLIIHTTNDLQVKALFERIGEYDHLISSSGRGVDKPFLESSVQDLRATWEPKYWLYVNVARYGEFLTTQHF